MLTILNNCTELQPNLGLISLLYLLELYHFEEQVISFKVFIDTVILCGISFSIVFTWLACCEAFQFDLMSDLKMGS